MYIKAKFLNNILAIKALRSHNKGRHEYQEYMSLRNRQWFKDDSIVLCSYGSEAVESIFGRKCDGVLQTVKMVIVETEILDILLMGSIYCGRLKMPFQKIWDSREKPRGELGQWW